MHLQPVRRRISILYSFASVSELGFNTRRFLAVWKPKEASA